jgi:hypothetical protein
MLHDYFHVLSFALDMTGLLSLRRQLAFFDLQLVPHTSSILASWTRRMIVSLTHANADEGERGVRADESQLQILLASGTGALLTGIWAGPHCYIAESAQFDRRIYFFWPSNIF